MTELIFQAEVADSTIAAAIAGDVGALTRVVGSYHDGMARVAFVVFGDQDVARQATAMRRRR